MKITKRIIALSVFVILAFFITDGSYSGKLFKHKSSLSYGIDRYADDLELSEEQLTKIKEKQINLEKQTIEINSKIQLTNIELKELLDSENININEIKKKVEEIGKLRAELQFKKIQVKLEVKNILTEEQLKKLEVLKKERMKQRNHRGRRYRR